MEDGYKQFFANRQGMCQSDKVFRKRSVIWFVSSSATRTDHCFTEIPDNRIEGIWRQVLDVFRGGILADW